MQRLGPLVSYQKLLDGKKILANSQQLKAVEALEILANKISNYDPKPKVPLREKYNNRDLILSPDFKWMDVEEQNFISKLRNLRFSSKVATPVLGPVGLYIYGGVGTGKSMLMDLFYNSVPVKRKKRTHFHEFMQSVHRRIHQLKESHGTFC